MATLPVSVPTTLRLPEALKAEVEAYAASLGLSLNALCAVALRDYLDARMGPRMAQPMPASSVAGVRPAVSQKSPKVRVAAPVVYVEPAGGVYAPCPCGSGKKWKWCHGGKDP